MHEISIALSIIEIAEEKARERNSPSIQTIQIRLGEFTAVFKEALVFAFEAARIGTLAESARLRIETVPMVVRCALCGPVTKPARTVCLACPTCGLPLAIVAGQELEVEYIELETAAEPACGIAHDRCNERKMPR
jgi:hydrogenase nickel incorporation protein HypA/HybF